MARQGKVSPAIIIMALLTLLVAAPALGSAYANPINPPLINVDSPQNNKIYPSGEVQLNFIVVPNELITFTSATYSLDGQPEHATNGSTTLTSLPAGSHKLTVYGKGTYTIGGQMYEYNSVEAVIYFSVQYSTAWVTFAAVFAVAVSTVSITLWLTRRHTVSAFRGKKLAGSGSGWFCSCSSSAFSLSQAFG